MTSAAGAAKPPHRRRRMARGLMLLPMLLLAGVVALAASYVSYVLWPRWPEPALAPNAAALPIMVGEVTFNIPPGAIRVAVQRKAGVQERVDLVFLWPSLTAPDAGGAAPHPSPEAEPRPIDDRVFVSITATNGTLAPVERFKTIYPRYVAKQPDPAAAGMVAFHFQEGTPYQGEDLLYEAASPERFFVRCTHEGAGHIPGTCLAERRMRNADVIIRFPRDWLSDWRAVSAGIDRLIGSLKPH
jgi:hypothetical protein